MVVHTVGKNIVQPEADQSQTMFRGAGMALTMPLTGQDCR
jgi:hypothetical protein